MHVTHEHIRRIFKIKNELQEVYWNLVINTFAKSLIGIFVPIYLLTLGLSLPDVIIFSFFYFGALMLFSPFSASLTARVGFKHQILYRTPIWIFFYILLALMQFTPFSTMSIYLTGVLGGVASALYWIPLIAEFAKNTKKIHEGEEIAEAIAFPRLISILAPTAAAVILTALGFNILFSIVIFLVLLSVIPLFATADYKAKFTFSQGRKLLLKDKSLSARTSMRGVLLFTEGILWPLYIFVTLQDFLDVGIAVSVAAFGSVFLTFFLGRFSDRGNKKKLMRVGGLAYAFVWITRIFAASPLEIFLLSFLGGMFAVAIEISSFSQFCDRARGRKILDWVVVREVWLGLGRFLIMLAILLAAGLEFKLGFLLAAAASLVIAFI